MVGGQTEIEREPPKQAPAPRQPPHLLPRARGKPMRGGGCRTSSPGLHRSSIDTCPTCMHRMNQTQLFFCLGQRKLKPC